MTEAEKERAAVVAWVKRKAASVTVEREKITTLRDRLYLDGSHATMTGIACAIERGDHLREHKEGA